jgi:hypothetical protein
MSRPLKRRPSSEELKPEDLERLKEAHRQLREAVSAYEERFLGRELHPEREVPGHDSSEMAKAQGRIEEAEAELWRLREELLGWERPPGAPSALETIDWFSDEDRVFDEIDVQSS